MSDAAKAPYEKKAVEAKAKYEKAMEAWKKTKKYEQWVEASQGCPHIH